VGVNGARNHYSRRRGDWVSSGIKKGAFRWTGGGGLDKGSRRGYNQDGLSNVGRRKSLESLKKSMIKREKRRTALCAKGENSDVIAGPTILDRKKPKGGIQLVSREKKETIKSHLRKDD